MYDFNLSLLPVHAVGWAEYPLYIQWGCPILFNTTFKASPKKMKLNIFQALKRKQPWPLFNIWSSELAFGNAYHIWSFNNLIKHKTQDNPPRFISKPWGDGWIDGVHVFFFFISIHFLFPHIRVWQLSLEQAGTCITFNERQWVCTFITFQQPLMKKKKRDKKKREGEQRKAEQEKWGWNRFFYQWLC